MADKKKKKVILNPKTAAERKQALEAALKKIEKDMGKGAVMYLEGSQRVDVDVIPTGSLALNIALGIGGIPRGRVIEIYGPEATGKSTLALHMVAELQKMGGQAAYIDAEHALDPQYAAKIGVDTKNLIIAQPDSGEAGLEIAEDLARSGAVDLIVIDSVAALVPRSELEGNMGDSVVGAHARLMSQGLRKLTGVLNKSDTAVIFINQMREKIGNMYGSPETTTGGRALKFYSSVRIEVRSSNSDLIKDKNVYYGRSVRFKVVKNKVAAPFKEGTYNIIFGEGIDNLASLVSIGSDIDVIDKKGSWYSYGDERMGQGDKNAAKWLLEHPDKKEEIETKILDYYTKTGANLKVDKKEDDEDEFKSPELPDDIDFDDDDILNLDLDE